MSDKHYVGLDVTSFEDTGKHDPVSRVTLFLDDDNYYTAGDDTGKEITASCPSATQAMADALLAQLKGYQHQSFNADAANIDPAAELGDGVTVGGIYAGLSQIKDDGCGYSDISAPDEPEVEDEYPYISPIQQEISRKSTEIYSTITKTAEQIQLQVTGLDNKYSSLSLQVDKISTMVSGLDGKYSALEQTVDGFTFTDASGTVKISGGSVDAEGLHVKAANIDGTLTVDQIKMTGMITWADLSDDVQTTIEDAAETGGVSEKRVTEITEHTISTSEITADQITSGTINAGSLELDGLLALYEGNEAYGYVGASTAADFDAAVLTDSTMNYGFIASNGGARMTAKQDASIYVIASSTNTGCYSTYDMKTASDRRLKDGIEYGLDKYEALFRSLKPCSYLLKKETAQKRHWGFIAQDVQAALQGSGFDADKYGVLGYDGKYYSVGYSQVTALNTHMIQQLLERVERLEEAK